MPGFQPLERALGDACLLGHGCLGQLKIESAPRDTRSDLGKNGVIRQQIGYLHGRQY
jgi:hypothetical protein